MMLPRRRRVALAGAAAGLLLVGGCTAEPKGADRPQEGDVTITAGADGYQSVQIDATDTYRFVPAVVRVTVGKVRITLVNGKAATTHSLAFKPGGPTEEIPFLSPGDTKSIEFTIGTPGTYEYFCTFHEALNQRGDLIVSA